MSDDQPIRDNTGNVVPVTAPDYMLWLSIQHAQDAWEARLSRPSDNPAITEMRQSLLAQQRMWADTALALELGQVSPRADYELRKALRLARFTGDAEARHHALIEEEGPELRRTIEAAGGNYELEMAAKLAECRNVDKWRARQKAAAFNRERANAPERP